MPNCAKNEPKWATIIGALESCAAGTTVKQGAAESWSNIENFYYFIRNASARERLARLPAGADRTKFEITRNTTNKALGPPGAGRKKSQFYAHAHKLYFREQSVHVLRMSKNVLKRAKRS